MAKKSFNEEIASLENRKNKDDYFKERIIWGKGITISGLKMLLTIYLIFPGIIMIICGFPIMLFGLLVKPFTYLFLRHKINKLKKNFPNEYSEYVSDSLNEKEYYREFVHNRMLQY